MQFGNKDDLAKSLIKKKWYCIKTWNEEEDEEDTDRLAYDYVAYKRDWYDIEEYFFDEYQYESLVKEIEDDWYKNSKELINKFVGYELDMNLIPYNLR